MDKSKNIDGLMRACQHKRDDALSRTEQALHELESGDSSISFPAVARRANVSVAWLYRQPSIRERIEGMRDVHLNKKAMGNDPNQLTIQTLNNTIKMLREENHELRKQLEIVYGELYMQNNKDM